MPSAKIVSVLLIAALPLYATLNLARAGVDPATIAADSAAETLRAPDESRIAADLISHAPIVGVPGYASEPDARPEAEWTTIRSSVRNGAVLEFRVTSVYRAKAQGAPRQEVDSIVTYRMAGDRWKVQGVRVTDSREVLPDASDSAAENC